MPNQQHANAQVGDDVCVVWWDGGRKWKRKEMASRFKKGPPAATNRFFGI